MAKDIPSNQKRAIISGSIYRHMIEARSLAQRHTLTKQEFEDYIFATTDLLHNAADMLDNDNSLDSFSLTRMQGEANHLIFEDSKASEFAKLVRDEICEAMRSIDSTESRKPTQAQTSS